LCRLLPAKLLRSRQPLFPQASPQTLVVEQLAQAVRYRIYVLWRNQQGCVAQHLWQTADVAG